MKAFVEIKTEPNSRNMRNLRELVIRAAQVVLMGL